MSDDQNEEPNCGDAPAGNVVAPDAWTLGRLERILGVGLPPLSKAAMKCCSWESIRGLPDEELIEILSGLGEDPQFSEEVRSRFPVCPRSPLSIHQRDRLCQFLEECGKMTFARIPSDIESFRRGRERLQTVLESHLTWDDSLLLELSGIRGMYPKDSDNQLAKKIYDRFRQRVRGRKLKVETSSKEVQVQIAMGVLAGDGRAKVSRLEDSDQTSTVDELIGDWWRWPDGSEGPQKKPD